MSNRFIAYSQEKYKKWGVQGLKLAYKGSKPFLTSEQKEEIKQWLRPLERRNISELEGKNFLRRFYYLCKNFKIVKRLFKFFFDLKLYNSPNLENYDVFAQFI